MNLDRDQIDAVVAWMNEWEQLMGTAIPIRFRKDFSVGMRVKQPPIGVKPRWLVDDERRRDLLAAILRYGKEGLAAPKEWMDEYWELEGRRR
jgi:hypothetical protein